MMRPLPHTLKVTDINKLESYFPLRNKGNDFDWSVICGLFIAHILKKQVSSYDLVKFRADCNAHFSRLLEDKDNSKIIDRMYFSRGAIFEVSPLFLLFKAQLKAKGKPAVGAANWRMGSMLAGLFEPGQKIGSLQGSLNFLETEILKVLVKNLQPLPDETFPNEMAYLPYLAKTFSEDIGFLSTRPELLMTQLESVLKLYAFAYCSQLALNMRAWKEGPPISRKIFFILDSEKASTERSMVQNHGYKMFATTSEYLFPILSALENLQIDGIKRPMWRVFTDCVEYENHQDLLETLNTYIHAFSEARKLQLPAKSADTLEAAFTNLQEVAVAQFRDKNTQRFNVNKNYMLALEAEVGSEFIQSRGRAGKVLVLNQDQLVLLTNLAIGNRGKLRLHEVVNQFQRRGFYLDNQSQQVLVAFYERMGNIERMSDSGDAVYVRKTI